MNRFLKFFLLLLLLFYAEAGRGLAQKQGQAAIDSMLKEIPGAKEDTNKVKLLNALSYVYRFVNPGEGITYAQQSLGLATGLGWKKGAARANCVLGINYSLKSDNAKALEYYQKALNTDEEIGDKKGVSDVTLNIGRVYQDQSDYSKALEYDLRSLKIAEETGYKNNLANITASIGAVYVLQSEYPKALEYFLKALKTDEETDDKNGIANDYLSIAFVYDKQSDYPRAIEYDFKALKIYEGIGSKMGIASVTGNIGLDYQYKNDYLQALVYDFKAIKLAEEVSDTPVIADATSNIGLVYEKQENYTLAIAYEQNALKIFEAIGDKYNTAIVLCNIGNCYVSMVKDTTHRRIPTTNEIPAGNRLSAAIPTGKTARLRKAIDYLQRGLAAGREIHAMEVVQDCYGNLAEAFKLNGDYKKSLENTDKYQAVKDSVFSKENNEKIVKMGVQNEYDRQRLADSLKAEGKEKITRLQLSRQKSYTYMGLAGILLLAGFSFFIAKEHGKSERERKKSDALLLNILPEEVANELKANGNTTAKHFDNVTVLFTDFVNFTHASERMSPQSLIDELHTCFKAFDEITGKYHIEKIKTIGDAYLAVAGLPAANAKHAENVVKAALEINAFMQDRLAKLGERTFEIRIGIHSGSVVAGIVGVKKFAYDIWGDTVNTAARMEQSSQPGKINISQTTYELVKDKFTCEYRGEIDAKNKGQMKMYFVS